MNNKISKILIIVLVLIMVILGILCIIDFNKMKEGEPVVFSTWGRKYAPVLKEKEITQYSKLAEMYIAMLEDILAEDQALQENIKFIDIDFTNFRSPLTEEELVDVREKSYFLPNFKTEEEKTNWLNLIESKPLTEDVKQEIMDYLKEKFPGKEIKQNTYEELEQQKLADDKNGIKDGFMLYIEKAPKIKENSAEVELVKYRGPLGADFNLYSMEYKGNEWNLKLVREAVS